MSRTEKPSSHYQPSEKMCEIGTFVRNLMSTEKRAELTQVSLTKSMIDRALGTGDNQNSRDGSDQETRKRKYLETFCNKLDNAKENQALCKNVTSPDQQNADINFTQTVDAPLTLDINMDDDVMTNDEENLFAFLDYIFMHDTFPWMSANKTVLFDFVQPYQDMRSLISMRSVAQNSFAKIIAEKTESSDNLDESVGPFIKALMREMGVADADIEATIGENPSYYAQMEILTKRIYQHPEFISNLYDKPANVKRIRAALTAIKLMQDRDIHDALLRREMLMSILLELQLRQKQMNLITTEIQPVLKDAPGEPSLFDVYGSGANNNLGVGTFNPSTGAGGF